MAAAAPRQLAFAQVFHQRPHQQDRQDQLGGASDHHHRDVECRHRGDRQPQHAPAESAQMLRQGQRVGDQQGDHVALGDVRAEHRITGRGAPFGVAEMGEAQPLGVGTRHRDQGRRRKGQDAAQAVVLLAEERQQERHVEQLAVAPHHRPGLVGRTAGVERAHHQQGHHQQAHQHHRIAPQARQRAPELA
jgi:hypothetical protein